jgi:hypothetical protein
MMSSPLDGGNMEGSQFHEQLQEGIARWLKSGEKTGFTGSASETVVLSSVLGKRSENPDRTIFLRVKFDELSKPSIGLCDIQSASQRFERVHNFLHPFT